MKRFAAWVVLSWCVVCAAWAGEVEHKRGDFRFFVGDPAAFVQPHQVARQEGPLARLQQLTRKITFDFAK